MIDYPVISGLAALFGWMLWYLGFQGLGERYNPKRDQHSWPYILGFALLGGICFYPQMYFRAENGQILGTSDYGWSLAFYFAGAVGGFLNGFGLYRLWTRLRLGKQALADEDLRDSKQGKASDIELFESFHGPKDEERRMRRVMTPTAQIEASKSVGDVN